MTVLWQVVAHRKEQRLALLVGVAVVAAVCPSVVQAGAGDLDRSFGRFGRVFTPLSSDGRVTLGGFARQPDGRFLAVGSTLRLPAGGQVNGIVRARYESDGSLDASFGNRGRVLEAPVSRTASDVVSEPDGSFVTAGSSGGGFELARYRPDGSVDASFDGDGRVTTKFSRGNAAAWRLIREDDGRLVASGSVDLREQGTPPKADEPPSVLALARYRPDGSLDESFGGDGRVTTALGEGGDRGQSFVAEHAVQPDGKVLAVADNEVSEGFEVTRASVTLLRYNVDGSLDPSFGRGGRVRVRGGTPQVGAGALVLAPDGSMLVGGSTGEGHLFIARYLPDGSLDPSFGDRGTAVERFAGASQPLTVASNLVLGPRGDVFVGSTVLDRDERGSFAIAHFTAHGAIDRGFGRRGVALTTFRDSRHSAFNGDLILEPDGRLVAAGDLTCCGSGPVGFGLAAYHSQPVGALGRVARRPGLEQLAGRGLRVPLRCSQACRTRVELRLGGSEARRLGVPAVVGRSRADFNGSRTATVKLLPGLARSLRGARSRRLQLRVRFDAKGRTPEELRRRLIFATP